MCVYILADDIFFSSGLGHYLSSQGVYNKIIPSEQSESLCQPVIMFRNDIILIDIDAKRIEHYYNFIKLHFDTEALIIPVFDVPTEMCLLDVCTPLFLPKKTSFELIMVLLYNAAKELARNTSKLTFGEARVVKSLLSGKSLMQTAKELGVSIKTLSTHKINALDKLGLRRINAIFLLYYKTILDLHNGRVRGNLKKQIFQQRDNRGKRGFNGIEFKSSIATKNSKIGRLKSLIAQVD